MDFKKETEQKQLASVAEEDEYFLSIFNQQLKGLVSLAEKIPQQSKQTAKNYLKDYYKTIIHLLDKDLPINTGGIDSSQDADTDFDIPSCSEESQRTDIYSRGKVDTRNNTIQLLNKEQGELSVHLNKINEPPDIQETVSQGLDSQAIQLLNEGVEKAVPDVEQIMRSVQKQDVTHNTLTGVSLDILDHHSAISRKLDDKSSHPSIVESIQNTSSVVNSNNLLSVLPLDGTESISSAGLSPVHGDPGVTAAVDDGKSMTMNNIEEIKADADYGNEDTDALMEEIDNMKPKSNIPFSKEESPDTALDDMSDVSSLLSFLPQLSPYIKFDMKDSLLAGDKEGYLHLTVERADGSVHNLKVGGVVAATSEEIEQYDRSIKLSALENRADKQINLIEKQLNSIEKENDPFTKESSESETTCNTEKKMSPPSTTKRRGRPKRTQQFVPEQNEHGQEVYKCKVCGASVKTEHALIVHMRRHTGDKPFSCQYCGKSFTTKGNAKQHEGTHFEDKPFKCSYCGKCFKEKKVLKIHHRQHTGERPYKCPICGKGFSQNSVMKEHLLVHTGQKPHLCDLCGQEFRGQSSLRAHRLRHLNKRDYKCDKCEKDFVSKNDLNRHYLTHTGVRPFQCDICPKSFTRLNYLKEHLNIHNGTKPYSCQECNVSFTDSMTLHRHKKKHRVEVEEQEKIVYQSELEKELLSGGTQSASEEHFQKIEINDPSMIGEQTSVQVILDANTKAEDLQKLHSLVLSAANNVDFTLNMQYAPKTMNPIMCVNPDTQDIVDQGQGHHIIVAGQNSVDFSAINLLANATAQQYNI